MLPKYLSKIFFISLIIISNSFILFALSEYPAKDDSTKQTKTIEKSGLVFGELGGNGIGLSINYERYISDNLSFRTGLGTAIIAGAFLPLMINYSYKNLLEFGVGIVPFGFGGGLLKGKIFASQVSGILITSVVGFKSIKKNFIFKVSFTPFYNPNGSIFRLYGGLSLGIVF